MILPTGEQYRLAEGRQEAVVCEVGATLRHYQVDGRPVCWGFADDERSEAGKGQVLAPWPNRLEDGSYVQDGTIGQAALDEPERGNAIHGLVRWLPWRLVDRSGSSVRLACMLHHQPGYPFSVLVEIVYRLGPEGLEVATTATNRGGRRAPFGLGFHNYLHTGIEKADVCRLRLPARQRLIADQRMLPRDAVPVASTAYEVLAGEEPGELGDLVLDDCFTGIEAEGDGRWRARFVPSGGDDDAVTLWADARFAWVMVFTGDTLGPDQARRGVAIEPMTCPANALRSKEGLVLLAPGESFSVEWGLSPAALGSSPRGS